MKVLVLGGRGMLGHRLCMILNNRFEVWTTIRGEKRPIEKFGIIPPERVFEKVDIRYIDSVKQVLNTVEPDVVINAVGIVKQREEAKHAIPSILINSLFPHQLAELCAEKSIRMIQLTTDCVFSGLRGNYTEKDIADPVDFYGKSKLLGEVYLHNTLTLRTSFIGWQLNTFSSLLSWFAKQQGKRIKGFTHAIYSGFSTTALCNIIANILISYPDLNGLYHVSSAPISKFDLLMLLREATGWKDIIVEPDDNFFCDRSLNSDKFKSITTWAMPSWEEMIEGLAAEWPVYEQWYRK